MKRASWLLAGGAALLLAGCGQKGPLYLPDKNAKVVTTPAAPSPPSTPATAAPQKPSDKNDDSQTPK
jgi:diaminopimelate decarboxylase